jgi:hypothetical protein
MRSYKWRVRDSVGEEVNIDKSKYVNMAFNRDQKKIIIELCNKYYESFKHISKSQDSAGLWAELSGF